MPFAEQKNGNTIQGAAHGMMSSPHTAPVLSCCWSTAGDKIFTASADKTGEYVRCTCTRALFPDVDT